MAHEREWLEKNVQTAAQRVDFRQKLRELSVEKPEVRRRAPYVPCRRDSDCAGCRERHSCGKRSSSASLPCGSCGRCGPATQTHSRRVRGRAEEERASTVTRTRQLADIERAATAVLQRRDEASQARQPGAQATVDSGIRDVSSVFVGASRVAASRALGARSRSQSCVRPQTRRCRTRTRLRASARR